jgi:argininosuccinate lyase
MLTELVRWSSSFEDDRALAPFDLVGSAAHVTMLARAKLVPAADASALRAALLGIDPAALPPGEEDVHMAVEALLATRLGGDVAGRLHTARSRNDQVALDLRLFVRAEAARVLEACEELARQLLERAPREANVLLPAYTHRQRAQPITGAFLACAWCAELVRAAETIRFALDRSNELPLGSGACSGTSLPIDRALVQRLLRFDRMSVNALDTVGDRGFLLDFTYATTRVGLALAKIAADVVDMATSEFGLVHLGGEISAGSSMMPQKKNPDVFELVRGKAAGAVGDLVALLTLVKGLPSGYNRDQQEDRRALLAAGPRATGALRAMAVALPHVAFDPAGGRAALADGSTQATDLAEALVLRGVPFREAYKTVGALVRAATDAGVPLARFCQDVERARAIAPAIDPEALAVLDPERAARAKESPGGTGPRAVAAQIEALSARAGALHAEGFEAGDLAKSIAKEPLA